MPELPDVEAYLAGLRVRVLGQELERVRVTGVSLLRTYDPPLQAVEGRTVTGLRRLGKRLAIGLSGDLFLVLHLMIAGRLRWRERGAAIPRRNGLAAFDFATGTVLLTEAGTTRRASLHVVAGTRALAEHHRGGIEPLDATPDEFGRALTVENHTLKRALTDQRLISGIGNAYSDEILHRSGLSPTQLTANLDEREVRRLFEATREVLEGWTRRLVAAAEKEFPEKVTAFRPEFAVHGRHGQACPACGTTVQRIRYADRETNYCPGCQTGGRLLRDRALSRLLREDWPATLEEMEGD